VSEGHICNFLQKQEVRASKTLLPSSLLVLLAVWVLVHFFPKNKTSAENPFAPPFQRIKYKKKKKKKKKKKEKKRIEALPLKVSNSLVLLSKTR
jgi:hypothetical protein